MKKIAIIGQPNVGKSSLFNRIVKQRDAIVSDVAGTTRDIKKREVEILDREALLLDTGGIDETNDEIFSSVKENAINLAKEADIVLYMVDGKKLPDDKDKELFYSLQSLDIELFLVINKLDNAKEEERIWEFSEFGIDPKNIFGISVSHNRNTKRLFEALAARLPEPPVSFETLDLGDEDDISLEEMLDPAEDINEQAEDNNIKIAIIGKVNVGKSSILNALTQTNRSVVSSIAGTTIDPVDESIEYEDKKLTFVDTAGIRRKGKIEGLEKYALNRTRSMLEQANLALVVLDASKGIADLDEKIAGLVDEFGLATIIVLNKWDENSMSFEEYEEEVRFRFKFLYYAPMIVVSAKTNRSIDKLRDLILEVYDNYKQRITTSVLNRIVETAVIRHALPSPKGQTLRIYYATQFETSPPTIALIMNKPRLLHFSYKRYLINFIRDNLNFTGSPIRIVARGRGQVDEDES
jgi:GTP-binding protein